MFINVNTVREKIMAKITKPVEIDFNPEFKSALKLMEESGKCLLITGRAGTGKSTLLNYFRHTTKNKVVILAPTGVAAINVSGQTIHSFFHFKPNVTPASIKKKKRHEKTFFLFINKRANINSRASRSYKSKSRTRTF